MIRWRHGNTGKGGEFQGFRNLSGSASHEHTLESALSEAANWKARALAAQQSMEALKSRALALKNSAQLAVDSNKSLKASLRQGDKQVEELQARVQHLSEDNQRIQKEFSQRSSQLQQQLKLLQDTRVKEMTLAKEKLEMLVERLRTSENLRRELKLQLESANQRTETLEKQGAQLRQQVSSLNSELAAGHETNKYLVTKLQADLEKSELERARQREALKLARDAAQGTTQEVIDRITELEQALSSSQRANSSLAERLAAMQPLETKVSGLESELFQASKENLLLKEAVETARAELEKAKAEPAQAGEAGQDRIESARSLNEQLSEQQDQNRELAAQLEEVRGQLQALNAESARTQQELTQKLAYLQSELEQRKEAPAPDPQDNLKKKLDAAIEKKRELEKKLTVMASKLLTAQADLEKARKANT